MSDGADLTHVFAFTDQREAVGRFYEDLLGVAREDPHDDSIWFQTTTGAQLVVHDGGGDLPSPGFVPWFHVDDLPAAFARAQARAAAVGPVRGGYFLAKDPDGRVIGVRRRRV